VYEKFEVKVALTPKNVRAFTGEVEGVYGGKRLKFGTSRMVSNCFEFKASAYEIPNGFAEGVEFNFKVAFFKYMYDKINMTSPTIKNTQFIFR
jgi:hypothetical protein